MSEVKNLDDLFAAHNNDATLEVTVDGYHDVPDQTEEDHVVVNVKEGDIDYRGPVLIDPANELNEEDQKALKDSLRNLGPDGKKVRLLNRVTEGDTRIHGVTVSSEVGSDDAAPQETQNEVPAETTGDADPSGESDTPA